MHIKFLKKIGYIYASKLLLFHREERKIKGHSHFLKYGELDQEQIFPNHPDYFNRNKVRSHDEDVFEEYEVEGPESFEDAEFEVVDSGYHTMMEVVKEDTETFESILKKLNDTPFQKEQRREFKREIFLVSFVKT